MLFARVPVPVPFIETAPREGGKGLWNIFQYCTGAMSRGRLVGLITAVFTPFGLYTIIIYSFILFKRVCQILLSGKSLFKKGLKYLIYTRVCVIACEGSICMYIVI